MSETYLSNLDQSEVLATTRQEFEASRLNIYFVDPSVPGAEALAVGLGEGSKVYMLDGTGNGLEQMASVLESLGSPVDAVHIYSHGKQGAIQLGGQWYDAAALDAAAATLARIGQSLNTGGDILLYGCNTASGSLGESFLARMARLASANVAASTDITGTGGDWQLEASSGVVDSAAQQPDGWLGSFNPGNTISGWGVMEGSSGNDSITGFLSSDRMYGHGGQDTLVGKEGNDVYIIDGVGTEHTLIVEAANQGVDSVYSQVKSFDLSAGQDTGTGGDAVDPDDTSVEYIILEAQEGFVAQNTTGNSQSQTIVGNALANNIAGGGGNDLLYGYDGNDYLDGGSGDPNDGNVGSDAEISNTMYGGKGDDNYIVRNVNDVVKEYANEGTDHVFSFHDYTLGDNLENLTLLGDTAKTATGNALNNELRGNAIANTLEGGAGNDTLYGSSQTDGTADILDGGIGNDAYYVYTTADTIRDSAGIDSVYAAVDYSLKDQPALEHLVLHGGATSAEGNALNNYITGNATVGSTLDGGAGNDTLEGGRGNDTFHVDSAGDMVIDHGGANELHSTVTVDLNRFANASIQRVELAPGNGNLNATAKRTVGTTLLGNAGNNILTGSNEADELDSGESGTDRLVGGIGNDHYVVQHNNVTVVENAGDANGKDTVTAHVDYTLAANVEELVLAGDATSGTGNNLANVIDGSGISGGVILHGGANSVGLQGDTLKGSTGSDQIYSYNANDSIDFGDNLADVRDVLYVSYRVAEADALDDPNEFDWTAYFSARGVVLPTGITVMYRGNPITITGPGIELTGSATATHLVGTDRNDTLRAADSDSTLDGGKGGDSMVGGSGSDVFYVDSVGPNGDTVQGGSGLNTIRSTVNIDLSSTDKDGIQQFKDIDAVELQGTAALTLKGYTNSSGMTLVGNSGANQIWGGTGADTIDGGAGADVMTGGDGNDVYVVDNAGDRITENPDAGSDSIYTKGVSINLGAANYKNVEFVQNVSSVTFAPGTAPTVKAGSQSISMTGTVNAETLISGNAGDTLDGGGGADSLVGGTGADKFFYYGQRESISGGEGTDTLTVRKNVIDTITLEQNNITGIEAVVLEAGTANAQAADVNASNIDASVGGVMVQGNSGYSNITGSAGNDSLYGGGGKDTINAGAGNDFVEITANAAGYGQLDGGSGEDTLSFGAMADKVTFTADGIVQRVGVTDVNVDASDFNIFSGGAGNDTLDASAKGSGMALAGGLGVDQLLGGAGNDTLITDGGNDNIRTGAGSDIVRLTAAAIGSTITVSDFDAGVDSVDDSALRALGWGDPLVTQNGANATLTWTNPDNAREKVTVILQNTVGLDVLLGSSKEVITDFDATDTTQGGNPNIPWDITTAEDSISITGGDRNDAIVSTAKNNKLYGGRGDDVLEGSHNSTMDGGEGNDTIYVIRAEGDASLSVNGGAGNDEIGIDTIGGGRFTLDGGAGDDILYFDSTPVNVTLDGNGQVSQIAMNGKNAEGTAQNIEMLWGSTGDDSVYASNVSSGDPSNSNRVIYGTGGGNDTYEGSYAADEVHLHRLDASSRVSLEGGSGEIQDLLIFDRDQAISMTLNDGGAISSLVADGKVVQIASGADGTEGTSITSFDHFMLGDKADTVIANANAISGIASNTAFGINAGGGNDSIDFGPIDNVNYYVNVDAEGGNDSLSVGLIGSLGLGAVHFRGGAGSDSLTLKTTDAYNMSSGQGVYLKFDSTGDISNAGLSYYDAQQDTGTSTRTIDSVTISGFEHFDGSENAGNYFDATAYTMQGGTLGLYGGAGHDEFYLGDVQAGSVTLEGGFDTPIPDMDAGGMMRPGRGDRFHIGDVGATATVKIDAGTGDEVKDKLDFDGSKDVRLTLNAKGDISGVSMGGQKVNITGTGLSAYEGTDGNDLIDARYVTSVDSQDNTMTLEGGSSTSLNGGNDGNDTIYTGNITGGQFIVEVGSGADSIIGGNGNDYIGLGDDPNDPDGAYINDDTGLPYSNDGNDTIATGGGSDTIKVFEQANGSRTTITDFNTVTDTLDDSGLLKDGWSRNITKTTGLAGVTVTYFKEDKAFHLQFTNQTKTTFLPAIRSILPSESSITGTGPVQIYGTKESDYCTITGSGDVTLDGNGGGDNITLEGGSSKDSLVIVATSDINGASSTINANGKSSDDALTLQGTVTSGSYNVLGDDGADQLYLEGVSGGFVDARGGTGNDSITLASAIGGSIVLGQGGMIEDTEDGNDKFYLGHVDGANVTARGGEGNDSMTLEAATSGFITLEGGEGADVFYLGTAAFLPGTSAPLTVRGGTDIEDSDAGDIVRFTGDGVTVDGSVDYRLQLYGIDSVEGTAGDDSIGTNYFNTDLGLMTIDGGMGNDTISGSSNMLLNGNVGDDLLILPNSGDATVKGGSGSDTLVLGDTLMGGSSANTSLMGNTGNILHTKNDNGVIDIDGVETITAGTSAFDIVVAGAVDFSKTNTVLEFGSAQDTLTLTDDGAGSTIRIRNFDWRQDGGDSILSSGADSGEWMLTNSVVDSSGKTTRTYSKDGKTVKVILEGTSMYDYSYLSSKQTKTLDGGDYYVGSMGSDVLTLNLGGNAPMYVNTFGSSTDGSTNRDSVYINVVDDVAYNDDPLVTIEAPFNTHPDGTSEYDSRSRLIMNGNGVKMTFGETTVQRDYGEWGGGTMDETVAALTSVEANGHTAHLNAWGFSKYHGTAGADSINTEGLTSAATTIEFEGMGGDDTYIGGAGTDWVHAGDMSASSRKSMHGGDNADYTQDYDMLFLVPNCKNFVRNLTSMIF